MKIQRLKTYAHKYVHMDTHSGVNTCVCIHEMSFSVPNEIHRSCSNALPFHLFQNMHHHYLHLINILIPVESPWIMCSFKRNHVQSFTLRLTRYESWLCRSVSFEYFCEDYSTIHRWSRRDWAYCNNAGFVMCYRDRYRYTDIEDGLL